MRNRASPAISILRTASYPIFLGACFGGSLLWMFSHQNWGELYLKDSFLYLLKAFEIAHGDWQPIHTHFFGWPAVLALFIRARGTDSLLDGMMVARIVSPFIIALGIFPLAALVKRLHGKAAAMLAVFLYATHPDILDFASGGAGEHVFILTLILMMTALIKAEETPYQLGIAAFWAAVSFYLRANGLVEIIVILVQGGLLCWVWRKPAWQKAGRGRWVSVIAAAVIFALVGSFNLWARYHAFGSAFDYGANSKYFVDDTEAMWSANLPAPTFWEYLGTHSIAQLYLRFVRQGLWAMAYQFYGALGKLGSLLLLFGTWHFVLRKKCASFTALSIFLGLNLMCFIPVWAVFTAGNRYLSPFYFAAFAILASYAVHLWEKLGQRVADWRKSFGPAGPELLPWVAALVFLLLPSHFPEIPPTIHRARTMSIESPKMEDPWAAFAAQALQGNVLAFYGDSMLCMNLSHCRLGGNREDAYTSTNPPMIITAPGAYASLTAALEAFRAQKAEYLILPKETAIRRAYFWDLWEAPDHWKQDFELVRSFHDGKVFREVSIYRIRPR